jgi:hypothetical protein
MMVTREDDLKELATSLTGAIARARRLNLPTSAYILSMALVEVSQALKSGVAERDEGSAVR